MVTPRYLGFELAFDVALIEGGTKKRELRINGVPTRQGVAHMGDTIELRGEYESKLLLYCTKRPMELRTAYPEEGAWGPFGEADPYGFVGESPARWALRERLVFAAKAGFHTLLLGESGSGKELCAKFLHALSSRAGRKLVTRNAAAFTESLIDADLFGNIAGFPNPGTPERPGLFGEADGGTLFFDEIGEMPTWLQAKLLRATDPDGEYTPLGMSMPKRCNVRVIAATNRELWELKHDFAGRMKTRLGVPGLNDVGSGNSAVPIPETLAGWSCAA
jgi:transcriptional regulator with GAF, ATPase, and Fis domain